MQPEDLDIRFGLVSEPAYMNAGEELYRPRSLQRLDDQTAIVFLSYLKTAVAGLQITQLNHECFIILWILDEKGNIWFSLEEISYEDPVQGGRVHHPFSRIMRFENLRDMVKLGHPTLIGPPWRARIGGEILYDDSRWLISNKSGRYGFRATAQNLHEAAREWARFGIALDVHYLGLR